MKKLTMRDRFRGVMIGMACGDALGAQVEFKPRGSFCTPTAMTGGGPHRLEPGQWTDDTSMALALADHLLWRDVGAPMSRPIADLMERWVSWMDGNAYSCSDRGCFDIGGRTLAALNYWKEHGEPLSAASKRPYPDGNGAVMRVAPVALMFLRDEMLATELARWQATLTHGRIAGATAQLTVVAIGRLLLGDTPAEALCEMRRHEQWETSGFRDPRSLAPRDVESGGHALDTLEASLWCMLRSDSPRQAIRMAVGLGHDADTTGAMAGAMAGARWGAAALPAAWTARVAWHDRLEKTADRLLEASGYKEKERAE